MTHSTRISLLSLCALVLVFTFASRVSAQEAPAAAQVRAGDAFMQSGQYREAVQQYEAAYAIDPDVAILERLANAYQSAGDGERAMQTRQRIAQQRGGYVAPPPPPPYYVAPSPLPTSPVYTYRRPAPVQRAGQQLINSGVGLLIAGYGMGLIGGGITMGANYYLGGSSYWYGAGGMLMIPFAGPFATAIYNSNYWWVVPWAVVSGGMQLSGLALAIAGGVVRAKAKPAHAGKGMPFALSPYMNAQGGGLAVAGTF
jgi:hypothetical protein